MSVVSLRFNEDNSIDATLVQQIQTHAKHAGKSKTDIIKDALLEYFKNHDFAKEAQRQSAIIAKFEYDTDYIDSDI